MLKDIPLLMPLAVAAAALAAVYLIRYCHASASWAKSLIKTASVAALAVAAWLAGGPLLLVAALGLCAAGDYLLSRDSGPQFIAGIGAFAAGHIAYVALFLRHPMADFSHLTHTNRLPFIALLALLGMVMAAILWRRAGDMRLPVMGYIPVILSMGIAALALPALGPLAIALPAALLFIISDVTLSLEMFVLPRNHPARHFTPFVIWPTYWLAQFGFFAAFAGMAAK